MSILKRLSQLSASTKILIGWTVVISGGLYTFVLAKQSIENNRREVLLARQRIERSNVGDYEKPTARTYW